MWTSKIHTSQNYSLNVTCAIPIMKSYNKTLPIDARYYCTQQNHENVLNLDIPY